MPKSLTSAWMRCRYQGMVGGQIKSLQNLTPTRSSPARPPLRLVHSMTQINGIPVYSNMQPHKSYHITDYSRAFSISSKLWSTEKLNRIMGKSKSHQIARHVIMERDSNEKQATKAVDNNEMALNTTQREMPNAGGWMLNHMLTRMGCSPYAN